MPPRCFDRFAWDPGNAKALTRAEALHGTRVTAKAVTRADKGASNGWNEGNSRQDQERAKHAQDHESDGDGGRIEDAPRSGAHARCSPVCRQGPRYRRSYERREPRVSSPVHGVERRLEGCGLYPRHDRQGFVRRYEHERVARFAPEVQGARRSGQDGRSDGYRRQGARFSEPPARENRVERRATGRYAAPREADRRGEG